MSMFVVFDVMDTLIYDPYKEVLSEFFDMPLAELWARKDRRSWLEFERGELSEEQHAARFFADGSVIDGEALKRTMLSQMRWIDGMESLLEELRDRSVPVFLLSNYPVWFEALDQRFQLRSRVDATFVSYQTGVRKPKPGAFQQLQGDDVRCLDQGLFVDDREDNCQAARSLGLRSHCFREAPALRAWLSGFLEL